MMCPRCRLIGAVRIEFVIWEGRRYVHGSCDACHRHWTFPDRRRNPRR
jgi:hypothetical protein